MLKRAYLSIMRRKSKTILMFVILFIVANLVLTTIAIKNATDEATEFAKSSIGSEVTLSIDMQGVRGNRANPGEGKSEESDEEKSFTIPTISINDALSIADSKYISGYSYGYTTYANVVGLETVESEMEKMEDIEMEIPEQSSNVGNRSQNMGKMGGQKFNFSMKDIRKQMVSGDIKLEAINSFLQISEVKNETIELTAGTSTLTDENTVIISYDFAELNELVVGSKITLQNTESEEKITLTVEGIYDTSEQSDDMQNMLMNSSNTMYVNLTTGESFMDEETYNEGDYGISNCIYYLTDPNNYEAFVEESSIKVDLESKNLKLSIDESTYERMVGSIEAIGSFATIVLIVVIVAAVFIISLVVNGQIKERNYEIGVLLSLGEKKRKILGQIATELVIIATFAFLISMLTGSLLANVIGDNLSVTQKNLKTEQMEMMGNRGKMPNNFKLEIESEETNIDVSVGITECVILFGVGYLIILVSMVLPIISIVRYDPKAILTRRD